MTPALSPRAQDLVFRFEGFSLHPEVPGFSSGVTIGIGYDLGYVDYAAFAGDWKNELDAGVFTRLASVVGKTRDDALRALPDVKRILISRDSARRVFLARSVPHYWQMTRSAFAGFDELPADAHGALFSLVFNRGDGMDGDRRKEMREIRAHIVSFATTVPRPPIQPLLESIAREIHSMERLWPNRHDSDGDLADRRHAEALLVSADPKLCSRRGAA